MKVFLSWSGENSQSHQVAEALRGWLPQVIQKLEPWISSQDISAGISWRAHLDKELFDTSFGILAITHESKDKPFLLFEAGALSRQIKEKSYVCPYYFDIKATDITEPLSSFQGVNSDANGTYKLLESINDALGEENKLSDNILSKSFRRCWPELEGTLSKIRDNKSSNRSNGDDKTRDPAEILEEILMLTRRINQKTDPIEDPFAIDEDPFATSSSQELTSITDLLFADFPEK